MRISTKKMKEKLIEALKKVPEEKKFIEEVKVVSKIFDLYNRWDGDAATLDTNAFTEEEALVTIRALQYHYEAEADRGIMREPVSLIVTGTNLRTCLLYKIPHKKKVVSYI